MENVQVEKQKYLSAAGNRDENDNCQETIGIFVICI